MIYASQSLFMENNTIPEESIDFAEGCEILPCVDFYVSVDGDGDGSYGDPANWTYAYSNIASERTIYLLPGTYTNIINQNILKSVNILGQSDGVIIDLNNSGYAFDISAFDVKVDNIKFINGNATQVINFLRYGVLTNCIFENNTVFYSDVVGSITSMNNTFKGDYIGVPSRLVKEYASIKFKINDQLITDVYINGEYYNSTTKRNIDVSNLELNKQYIVSLVFKDNINNNIYINTENKTFTLSNQVTLYVSPEGSGKKDGTSDSDSISYKDILSHIAEGCKIIFLSGTYEQLPDIFNIFNNLEITGQENVIFSLSVFNINKVNITINNINFDWSLLSVSGVNKSIINCNFTNNAFTVLTISGDNNSVINCTFDNVGYDNLDQQQNRISINVGGKYNIIDNCNFINSSGRLYNKGLYTKIINSYFNTSVSSGYDIVYLIDNPAIIENCTFEDLTSVRSAIQLFNVGTSGTIINNCTFKNILNMAGQDFAAVRAQGSENITVMNSKFINASMRTGSYCTVQNCTFTGSFSQNQVLMIYSRCNNTIVNCITGCFFYH